MDDDVIPEPGRLLTFVRKPKEVFDVCDEDSDGVIRLEHLLQLGSQFGQDKQVRTCVICLFHSCFVSSCLKLCFAIVA